MANLIKFMEEIKCAIEEAGYKIESSALDDMAKTFNISYYDVKHMTKYSFVAVLNEKYEIYIKVTAAFISGIEDDFTTITDGSLGPINISNIGKSMECKIEYKLKSTYEEYEKLKIKDVLKEVEDSIYSVRYRKNFAL